MGWEKSRVRTITSLPKDIYSSELYLYWDYGKYQIDTQTRKAYGNFCFFSLSTSYNPSYYSLFSKWQVFWTGSLPIYQRIVRGETWKVPISLQQNCPTWLEVIVSHRSKCRQRRHVAPHPMFETMYCCSRGKERNITNPCWAFGFSLLFETTEHIVLWFHVLFIFGDWIVEAPFWGFPSWFSSSFWVKTEALYCGCNLVRIWLELLAPQSLLTYR